jgi:hypothetical protein
VALILLLSALALGAAIVRRSGFALYVFEAAALAVVLGLFAWVWLVFAAALVLPYALALPLAVVVAAAATVALWLPVRASPPAWRPMPGGRLLWTGATAATLAVLVPLFWTHNLISEPGGVYSAGSTWADFGLHAAIVSHLAQFDRMPLDLPIASGTSITYPFLVDLLSAVFLRSGWGLHLSLFVPGVLLVLAGCQLVIAFGLRLFGHLGAAVGGLAVLLLTGSAAGLPLAYSDWRASGRTLTGFLGTPPRDYTTLSDHNANVTNIVAHALLPQRAFLFGLGVTLTVLILFHTARETGERRHLFAGAVLVGLLPMAHPHSFLACGIVLATLTAEAALRRRGVPWNHLAAGALALVIAAPQLVWQQVANHSGSGGRFRFGWMVQPDQSIWAFWWANFGLMGLVFLALPILLLAGPWRHHLVWYVPALVILAVTQVYAFQPFEYDNLKLIYYAYLLAGLFASFLAVQAYRAHRASLLLVLPVALAVVTPGILSLSHEFGLHDQFASKADLALADWVRADTEPGAVFLTTDRPNQPISALGGRSIVMGYTGWLFNFSLPYDDRRAAVEAALKGQVDDPAVRRFHPDYLAVAAREGDSWTVDREALAALPVAYTNPEWTVYRLVTP